MKKLILFCSFFFLMNISFGQIQKKDTTHKQSKLATDKANSRDKPISLKESPNKESETSFFENMSKSDKIALASLICSIIIPFLLFKFQINRENRKNEELRLKEKELEENRKNKASNLIRKIIEEAKKIKNQDANKLLKQNLDYDIGILDMILSIYRSEEHHIDIVSGGFLKLFEGIELYRMNLIKNNSEQFNMIDVIGNYSNLYFNIYALTFALSSTIFKEEDIRSSMLFYKLVETFDVALDLEAKKAENEYRAGLEGISKRLQDDSIDLGDFINELFDNYNKKVAESKKDKDDTELKKD